MSCDQNGFGEKFLEADQFRKAQEYRTLKNPPVLLSESQRAIVLDAVCEVCAYRGWKLYAVHVRSNHVHIVVGADVEPEKLMSDFKLYSSRKLNSLSQSKSKYWTKGGSKRYLWENGSLSAAVLYVKDHQGKLMAYYGQAEPKR